MRARIQGGAPATLPMLQAGLAAGIVKSLRFFTISAHALVDKSQSIEADE